MRTASPLTAIRHIRVELEKLEAQFVKRKAEAGNGAVHRAVPQSCRVCGRPGHNSRRHKKR